MGDAHHCSGPPVSEMTYTVSSGTLNPSIPYHTSPSTSKQNIGNRTPLSDWRRKEIYQDVRFFHGALQLMHPLTSGVHDSKHAYVSKTDILNACGKLICVNKQAQSIPSKRFALLQTVLTAL